MARGPGAHHDERRREIADAVLEVVADRGLQAVSLTSVAEQAAISPGRIQHYYRAKHDLLTAAFDRGNELNTARIRARLGRDITAAPAREVLAAVLAELIPDSQETRAQLRVRQAFAALALADETIADRLRTMYADLRRQLGALIHRDQEAGRVPRVHDPADAATALSALAEGLAYYVLIDHTTPDAARGLLDNAIGDLYTQQSPTSRKPRFNAYTC